MGKRLHKENETDRESKREKGGRWVEKGKVWRWTIVVQGSRQYQMKDIHLLRNKCNSNEKLRLKDLA